MENSYRNQIWNFFKTLSQEAKELYLRVDTIDTIDAKCKNIGALEFHQKYVSKNIPLLIKNGIAHWPAVNKWSTDYFRRTLFHKNITVAVTPNGYADAVVADVNSKREYFVMPEERQMTMLNFLNALEDQTNSEVLYIQQQNSNFQNHFFELWRDVETPRWASEALGKNPDAINFWMGDKRAITSMHKDPYENIYCVVSGEKNFILHPPTDLPWIPHKKYSPAKFKNENGSWTIEPVNRNAAENSTRETLLPWISVDPLNTDYAKYPEYKNATTINVKVESGDVLYLPSLWFHHVQQSHACIAINFWYDMEYDIKYAYFKALESLC